MRTRFIVPILAVASAALPALAQTPLTWDQVKTRFENANPTLRAGQLNIAESKASEITAFLRPNPNMTFSMDQFQFFNGNPYRPFGFLLPFVAFDYLHERQHKRELRLESAQKATSIAESQQLDLERTMLFTLRSAFVQTLQAKQLLIQAQENLDYFNKELAIFRSRFQSGDIARVDFDRMQMQRPQYESDYQNALVNSRTARITLRMLLNDQTPVDKFDITGPFEFKDQVLPLEEFHTIAEAARPDLKAAVQAVDKAHTDYKLAVANGSTDPTFGMDFARNPPIPLYMGVSVNIPLRIFDRNQGEKARTQIDITHAERQKDAAAGAGLQRRRFGLRHPRQLHQPAQALSGSGRLPPNRHPHPRHHVFLLSARPGCARRLPRRPARLPRHRGRLHQPGRRLHDRGQPVEPGRRPRSVAVAAPKGA